MLVTNFFLCQTKNPEGIFFGQDQGKKKTRMNWLLVVFSICFLIAFIYLMLQLLLAVLASSRQMYVLITALVALSFALLAMFQSSSNTPVAIAQANVADDIAK